MQGADAIVTLTSSTSLPKLCPVIVTGPPAVGADDIESMVGPIKKLDR